AGKYRDPGTTDCPRSAKPARTVQYAGVLSSPARLMMPRIWRPKRAPAVGGPHRLCRVATCNAGACLDELSSNNTLAFLR
ncbi:hypothetical protein PspLS_06234, partial [Pyricularia sp. CBS 133598]